jgi:hypothetical protein
MRTKELLLTAALSAVGIGTSVAQVYSVNAVGYVNVTGLRANQVYLLANPLNATNNNAIGAVLQLPDTAAGSTVYRWSINDQNYEAGVIYGGAGLWIDGMGNEVSGTLPLNPGSAFFFVPSQDNLNITFVGEVPQGLTQVPLGGGPPKSLSFFASAVPQQISVSDAGLEPSLTAGDSISPFVNDPNTGVGGYSDAVIYSGAPGVWVYPDASVGPGPSIPVAHGAVLKQDSAGGTSWDRTFDVNNP